MSIFSFVTNWFRGGRPDLYRPRERLIYSYHTGERVVRADPLVLYRRVMDEGPELAVDIKVSQSPMAGAGAAQGAVAARVRRMFGLKPLADGGLGEVECVELLDHFLEYCSGVKKNTGPTPTSAAATSAPTAPSWAAAPPTPPTSASGSTASASPPAGPAPSPSGPPSPSA